MAFGFVERAGLVAMRAIVIGGGRREAAEVRLSRVVADSHDVDEFSLQRATHEVSDDLCGMPAPLIRSEDRALGRLSVHEWLEYRNDRRGMRRWLHRLQLRERCGFQYRVAAVRRVRLVECSVNQRCAALAIYRFHLSAPDEQDKAQERDPNARVSSTVSSQLRSAAPALGTRR